MPSYDAAGDVTEDATNQYLYDDEGRVCAVLAPPLLAGWPANMVQYIYDAEGRRVAKGSITTWSCDITSNGFQQTAGYVVGPSGEQLTEVDAADVTAANPSGWAHTNIYAGGKQIGTYDAVGLHFYVDDPLGTRRAQVNASGVLEATYQSLPFGDGYNSIPYAAGATDPTENHFTGKERDAESGNDYFGARYYNSSTGRWLSPDWSAKEEPVPYAQLGNPQSLNLYAYVGDSPETRSDPSGHAGCALEGIATSCMGLSNSEGAQELRDQIHIGGAFTKKDTTPARFLIKGKPKNHGSWMEYHYQLANAEGKPLTGTTIYDPTGSNNTATEYKTLVNHTSADTGPRTVTSPMPYGEVGDKVGWEAPNLPKADVDQIVDIAFSVNYQGKTYPITTQMQHENKYSDGKYRNTVRVVVP